METEPSSETSYFLKILDSGQNPETRRLFRLTSVVLFSLFWNSWPLKLGLMGCPVKSVRNYHTTLRNISEELRSHMIWQCKPFVWLCMIQFRVIWFSALYANLRGRHILKCQI